MLLPSLSMVFDGSVPLVKRCDGFDGSLWSKSNSGVGHIMNALIFGLRSMDHKSFFFYPFSLTNITDDLNQQRQSWWKLTFIISGSTWPFLPSRPDPVVKISVTSNLAVVKEIIQVNIKSLSMRDQQESPWEYIFNFIFHYPSSTISMSLLLANKRYFPRFTLKKKAFNLCNSWLTSLKLKSWVTLFSNWSVLEELASWKYHASLLWASLGPTLCPGIGERLGNFFGDLASLALALGCAWEKGCRTGGGWALWWRKRNRLWGREPIRNSTVHRIVPPACLAEGCVPLHSIKR